MKDIFSNLSRLVKDNKPTYLDMVYYVFWEKGISKNEFDKLPLRYIFSIIKTHSYIKDKEEKSLKKSSKRK
jgi:hypothetical protein